MEEPNIQTEIRSETETAHKGVPALWRTFYLFVVLVAVAAIAYLGIYGDPLRTDNGAGTPGQKEATPLPYPTPPPDVAAKFPEGFPKDIPWREDFVLKDSRVTRFIKPEMPQEANVILATTMLDASEIVQLFKNYFLARRYKISDLPSSAKIPAIFYASAPETQKHADWTLLDYGNAGPKSFNIEISLSDPQSANADTSKYFSRCVFPQKFNVPTDANEVESYNIDYFVLTGKTTCRVNLNVDQKKGKIVEKYKQIFEQNGYRYISQEAPFSKDVVALKGIKEGSDIEILVTQRGPSQVFLEFALTLANSLHE